MVAAPADDTFGLPLILGVSLGAALVLCLALLALLFLLLLLRRRRKQQRRQSVPESMARTAGASYRVQKEEEEKVPRMLMSPVVTVLATGDDSGAPGDVREGVGPTARSSPTTAAGAPGVSRAATAVGPEESSSRSTAPPPTQGLSAAGSPPTVSPVAATTPEEPPPEVPPGDGSTVVTVTATLLPPPMLVVQRSSRKLQEVEPAAPATDAAALACTPGPAAPLSSAAPAGLPNRLPPVSGARGVPTRLLASPGRTSLVRPVPMEAPPPGPPVSSIGQGSGEARAVFRAASDLGVVALHAREVVGGDAGDALAEAAALLQRRRAALARLEMDELLQKRSLALQQRHRRAEGLGYPGEVQRRPDGVGYPGGPPWHSERQAYPVRAYDAGARMRPEALGLYPSGRDRLATGREGFGPPVLRQPLSLAASRWFAPQAAAAAAASVGDASSSSSSSSSSAAAWGYGDGSGRRLPGPAVSARVGTLSGLRPPVSQTEGTLPGLRPPVSQTEGRGQLRARIASLPPGWVVALSHQEDS